MAIITTAVSSVFGTLAMPVIIPTEHIEQIKIEVVLPPQLKIICSCESTGGPYNEPIQFKDGQVLLGEINPNDIGQCQINQIYWGKKAKELGYDIFTDEGNKLMSIYIYNTHGTWPWNWSKFCWYNK